MRLTVTYDLYRLRIQAGLTLQHLAALSGVSKSTINDIENGKKDTTVKTLCKLAFALNVKFKDLVHITVYKN